jgi:hypothetical protein
MPHVHLEKSEERCIFESLLSTRLSYFLFCIVAHWEEVYCFADYNKLHNILQALHADVGMKSFPDPMPLNLHGTPEMDWEAFFVRSFGA